MTDQTRIQAMHGEWLRASNAYERYDRAHSDAQRNGLETNDEVPDALKRLWRQMCQLSRSILLTQPDSILDAAILATHIAAEADIATNYETVNVEDGDNLQMATAQLAAFLIDQASQGGRPDILRGDGVDWCTKQRDMMRGEFVPTRARN